MAPLLSYAIRRIGIYVTNWQLAALKSDFLFISNLRRYEDVMLCMLSYQRDTQKAQHKAIHAYIYKMERERENSISFIEEARKYEENVASLLTFSRNSCYEHNLHFYGRLNSRLLKRNVLVSVVWNVQSKGDFGLIVQKAFSIDQPKEAN